MFHPNDPTIPAAELDFQIEPMRAPLFQILQTEPGSDRWVEVGYVWTMGSSRTNSLENWYLYDRVPEGSERMAYRWPGYDSTGRIVGTQLRLEPATPPNGVDPTTFKDYLERKNDVTLTYVKSVCSQGR